MFFLKYEMGRRIHAFSRDRRQCGPKFKRASGPYILKHNQIIPANTRHWLDAGLMLARGLRRNIKPTSGQCLVLTAWEYYNLILLGRPLDKPRRC